ncbi:calpastatin isoform X3 [Ascaphus truei]|uniref:calpastatin isoform X3 n=2 Tax=Ascaphus truei TaxID=8439 RepID=UPI003F5A255A
MPKPKGKKHPTPAQAGAAKGSKECGGTKTADKKVPEAAEKKPTSPGVSEPAAARASGTSKVTPSKEHTMKPADTKVPEPAKSTQPTPSTKPKGTTKPPPEAAAKPPPEIAAKPSAGKVPPSKQDKQSVPVKQKDERKVSAGAPGKVAAVAAAGTVAVAAAATVASSKPKDEEEKRPASVAKVAASSKGDDALDELSDMLGGPDDVPKSPKFTGPEIPDKAAMSAYLEELGKREGTIPPEYRHLLDGKGGKVAPLPKEAEKSMGDDDLVEALSSGFVSCQAPSDEKKQKLAEHKVKRTSASAVASDPGSETGIDDALDQLVDTLEGPQVNVPESPVYTGPDVMETVSSTHIDELGKRESTIPPAYRNLLDGKDHGQVIPPPVPAEEMKPMSDTDLADEFSKDFDDCCPADQPAPGVKPKDPKEDKKAKSDDVVVVSSASSVQAAAAPSAAMEDAMDELMGTLDDPEPTAPEPPAYTGPVVTEMRTATHIEELGKRDSTIPPEYRHLLDGKEGGQVVPPTPEEPPMSETDLADEFSKDFDCPKSAPVQQAPPTKPKVSSEEKKTKTDEVVSATSSVVQSSPAPPKVPVPKADPIDALAGTLGVRPEQPKDKKPAVDKVKEKTDQGKKEKLGKDEKTVPPEYRLKEVKDKDGKPILPKAEEKLKPMSEVDLLDALSEGFVTSPTTPLKTAPLSSPAKKNEKPSGSEEVVSFSKVSGVQSGAPHPPASDVQIPDDALDLLSDSLGSREVDPDENKPIVDVVKEKAKSEHIDKLGERDDTIPPEYRHLLDDNNQGKPTKPVMKHEEEPKKPVNDDAAIDALSSGFESCDTRSAEKSQPSLKDKCESSSSKPVSKPGGNATDPTKEKPTIPTKPVLKDVEKPKPTNQPPPAKPSVEKSGKS